MVLQYGNSLLSSSGAYCFFFFFKQKTAYEIASCLVGSEMCIRDRQYFTVLSTDSLSAPCHVTPLVY